MEESSEKALICFLTAPHEIRIAIQDGGKERKIACFITVSLDVRAFNQDGRNKRICAHMFFNGFSRFEDIQQDGRNERKSAYLLLNVFARFEGMYKIHTSNISITLNTHIQFLSSSTVTNSIILHAVFCKKYCKVYNTIRLT